MSIEGSDRRAAYMMYLGPLLFNLEHRLPATVTALAWNFDHDQFEIFFARISQAMGSAPWICYNVSRTHRKKFLSNLHLTGTRDHDIEFFVTE